MNAEILAKKIYQEAVENPMSDLGRIWNGEEPADTSFFDSLTSEQRTLMARLLRGQLIDSIGIVLTILNGTRANTEPVGEIIELIKNEELAEEFFITAEENLGKERTGPAVF